MKKITKNNLLLSPKDIKQIEHLGINRNTVKKQLDIYRRGASFLKLHRPCMVGDGILSFNEAQRNKLISLYEKESEKYKLTKFVPASGAASRMFADWFAARETGGFESPAFNEIFLTNFKKYPFYPLIDKNKNALGFLEKEDIRNLLDYVLSDQGLNFGWLPKALIPFHFYHAQDVRTALEEHFIEAALHIRGDDGICHLHFTISEEHKKDIAEKIKNVKSKYEKYFGIKYKISYSIQSPSTKTLAVNEDNMPLRDAAGRLIFRPAGHGSLLSNLQNIDADFIFIKNIDNIAPEKILRKIIPYKKILGGLAMHLQKEIFGNIRRLKNGRIRVSEIEEIKVFCMEKLNIVPPRKFTKQPKKEKVTFLLSLLNRPLRICAMVKNEGEPGGGPFWVEGKDGTQTLQIVEGIHVDIRKKDQRKIWSRSKYFNPVDMVCSIKNYHGKKFNLSKYVDKETYLITRKNEKGMRIKALEVPGLWNGGMACWNTVFVKLPIIVFNPVKTVDDLLRPEHLVL
jgi:hypothetical protein